MVPLDRGTFRAWLDEYAAAWESGDPDATAALFTADATYQETPFAESLVGRDAIRKHWVKTAAAQEAVTVETTVESLGRDHGVAQFDASFVRDDETVHVAGLLKARFVAGNCVECCEWWHAEG